MLRKGALPFLVVLLLISFYTGNRFLTFAILMLLAMSVVIVIWNRNCFNKLYIYREFSRNNIFPGEEVDYIVVVENRKLLPIFWLQINDLVTKGIDFLNSQTLTNQISSPYNVFTDTYSLKWYEKVIHKYRVKATRRGYFTFGKAEVRSSDLFGVNVQIANLPDKVRLLVYPRILPIEKFGMPKKYPFGRKQMNSWIYQDPTNKVGVRPYQQGDRFNQINWKATARAQELHSNVIKPTMDPKVQIILNTRMMNNMWEGFSYNNFELAVIAAASVVEYGLKENYQVGLLTNGVIYEESSFVKILPGKSSSQRERLLKALAMIEPCHYKDIDEMIYREIPKLEVGTIVVFITPIINQSLVDCMRILQKRGYVPTVIKIGEMDEEFAQGLAGIPTYTVDEERLWNEIEDVQFNRESVG